MIILEDLKDVSKSILLPFLLIVLVALALFRGLVAVGGLIQTTTGHYAGVIQDVQYGGIIFNSCEVRFKTNSESSTFENCSLKDKTQCMTLKDMVGKSVKVEYRELLGQPLTLGSGCVIEKVTNVD